MKFSRHDGAPNGRKWIRRRTPTDEYSFLFVNLMEAHSPYCCPKRFQDSPVPSNRPVPQTPLRGDIDREPERAAYEDCVEYLAHEYELIYEHLEAEYDYVITVGDHGELFGEGGAFQHFYGLHPNLTKVPLTISGPDVSGKTCDTPVSLVDVFATICAIFDVDETSDGRDLRSESLSPQPVYTEYHGLGLGRVENWLGELDQEKETVRKYNRPLRGVASDDGYAFETHEGLNVSTFRGSTEKAEKLLDEHGDLQELDISKAPSGRDDHLADLGYL